MKLKHYLIASEENDYKPWIITPVAMGVFCLVIWSLRLIIPTSLTLASASIDANDLMSKINQQRTQRFIPALVTNSKLISAAGGKANDMLTRSYFAHVDPDGNYVWPRIEAAGYAPYLTLGENLAMDFNSADGVIDAWMNSPTHRANIVNEKFEDQGLASIAGLFEPNHNTIMVVSLFGTLMKTKSPTPPPPPPVTKPQPTPTPVATKPQPPPPPVTKQNPSPTPSPTPVPTSKPASPLSISKDVKISSTSLSGHTMVNIDVVISGQPSLTTARLKTQSITLIAGKVAGEYIGSFTFDPGEDLTNQTLTIETRDESGTKTSLDYPVNITGQTATEDSVAGTASTKIPVSSDAQVIRILRIIFGVFATIYMAFLAIDAYIIHRAKIKRPGINTNPHLLVFLILISVTLFANWF